MKTRYTLMGVVLALGILLIIAASTVPLLRPVLQSDMNGGGFCITNLSCLNVGTATISNLNLVGGFVRQITSTNNTVTVNPTTNSDTSITVDLETSLTGISNAIFNSLHLTNLVSLRDGLMMPVAAVSVNTNKYWWDFGQTTNGQHIIYFSLDATNSVQFLGVTNGYMWQPLSFNVVARGANITMFMPTNLPHFNTNFWTLSGSLYTLVLTNGNELRMTLQSNQPGGVPTLSTLWTTFGQ